MNKKRFRSIKTVLACALGLAMFLALVGCQAAQDGQGEQGALIGISMPTQSSERWIKDGNTLKELLEEKGYTVDLQFAEDDIPTQKLQVENMRSFS